MKLIPTLSFLAFISVVAARGSEASDSTLNNPGEIVLAAFAADSHCLGPHWIYDLEEIQSLYPDGVANLDSPKSSYHPNKGKGDLTHYGDQSLVLLEHLAQTQNWDPDAWLDSWQSYWLSEPKTYLDAATSETMENLAAGKRLPSDSHDLSAVSRMGPLLALLNGQEPETVIAAVRQQCASTHGKSSVIDSAEFITRLLWAVQKESGYSDAIQTAWKTGSYTESFKRNIVSSIPQKPKSSAEAANYYGQSCDAESALPLLLWLALTYEDDPVAMLEQNALAGGDSSARGMILGMLIAAKGQFSELPKSWTTELNALDRIHTALQELLHIAR